MCGRVTREFTWAEVQDFLDLHWPESADISPSWNVSPTQELPVARVATEGAQHGVRELVWMRWGLVPFWAQDAAIGARLINARAETVAAKPAFRAAFKSRRCIVPVSGFYEWKKVQRDAPRETKAVGLFGELEDAPAERARAARASKPVKQPYYIVPTAGDILALAGLWESCEMRDGTLETFTIITTEANAMMARLHDRMPVVLDRAGVSLWLDADADTGQLQLLLQPASEGTLDCWAVGNSVNSSHIDEVTLIARESGR